MKNLFRRKLLSYLLGGLAISGLKISNALAQSNYFIPEILINAYLRKKFPISKDLIFLRLDLSNPELGFISKNQRISMTADFAALLNNSSTKGQLHLSSSFSYDPNNRSIKLKDPLIDQLNFKNISTKNSPLLDQLNVLIAKLFDNMTVYEIKDEDIPLIKKAPSKILVEDSGLRVFFE